MMSEKVKFGHDVEQAWRGNGCDGEFTFSRYVNYFPVVRLLKICSIIIIYVI